MAPVDDNAKQFGDILFREDPPWLMFISITGESGIGKNTVVINMLNLQAELKVVLFRVPPGILYSRKSTREQQVIFVSQSRDKYC